MSPYYVMGNLSVPSISLEVHLWLITFRKIERFNFLPSCCQSRPWILRSFNANKMMLSGIFLFIISGPTSRWLLIYQVEIGPFDMLLRRLFCWSWRPRRLRRPRWPDHKGEFFVRSPIKFWPLMAFDGLFWPSLVYPAFVGLEWIFWGKTSL